MLRMWASGGSVLPAHHRRKWVSSGCAPTFCDQLGEAPADVALAWLLHNPVVTTVLSGPRTVDQLLQNLKAPRLKLSGESLARLDAIWPGPGGEAPNAYAW